MLGMDDDRLTLRLARLEDVAALECLIRASVLELQAPDYTQAQREAALGHVFGVDRQLIRDQTYFVAEQAGRIVGCGGWSRRRAVFGADALAGGDNAEIHPGEAPARIRAFFVAPDRARQGIGSAIMRASEAAAMAHGFRDFELGATRTGVPLYLKHGFSVIETVDTILPDGSTLPVIRMRKSVAAVSR
jgi:GNAT superfamily N-acetyltransferase